MTLTRARRSRSVPPPLSGLVLPFLLMFAALGVTWAGAQDATPPAGDPAPAAAEPATQATDETVRTRQAPEGAAAAAPAQVEGYTLSPEKYQDAVNYARARYGLHFLNVAYGLVVLVVLLALGVAPRFRDWAEKVVSKRFAQVFVYAPLLLLTLAVLGLPLEVYGQSLSLKYNQSIQSWGSWAWDWAKGQIIGLIIGTILIGILYAVIRRSPKRWWFYFWLASIPILIFILFITPVIIHPLFYTFSPLEAKQPDLVASIEKVVERGGLSIPRDRMFEMNASTKLKSVNAYVTGFGASKRVVVWDNTIARMTTPQTLFVFGHEMGHYVLGHIPKSIAFSSVLLLGFLYLGYRGMNALLACRGERWRIRGADDWASLPVLLLLMTVFQFFGEPIDNAYSRALEHESDIYGLEVIHGIVDDTRIAGPEAFQILGEVNLSDPDPPAFIKFWLYSHPAISDRIVFARAYDPWSKGEPTRFVPGQ